VSGSEGLASHFGQNLRCVRGRAGISQEELGYRSGLHRTEIGLLERGARVPRIDTVLKLAAGLGVRIDSPLFEGISWSSGETTTTPGAFTFMTPQERHATAMKLAAEAREGQTETVDAAGLIREVRDDMEGRNESDEAWGEGES
jgi:transcriptional regulator with XRE-family HTH domain